MAFSRLYSTARPLLLSHLRLVIRIAARQGQPDSAFERDNMEMSMTMIVEPENHSHISQNCVDLCSQTLEEHKYVLLIKKRFESVVSASDFHVVSYLMLHWLQRCAQRSLSDINPAMMISHISNLPFKFFFQHSKEGYLHSTCILHSLRISRATEAHSIVAGPAPESSPDMWQAVPHLKSRDKSQVKLNWYTAMGQRTAPGNPHTTCI